MGAEEKARKPTLEEAKLDMFDLMKKLELIKGENRELAVDLAARIDQTYVIQEMLKSRAG